MVTERAAVLITAMAVADFSAENRDQGPGQHDVLGVMASELAGDAVDHDHVFTGQGKEANSRCDGLVAHPATLTTGAAGVAPLSMPMLLAA